MPLLPLLILANWLARRKIVAPDEPIQTRAPLLADRMSYTQFFKARAELTKAFCDTAKTYIQISSAALALPILFTQAFYGKGTAERGLQTFGIAPSLVLAWISFLLAIGFGLAYQWLSIRRMWDQLHSCYMTPENCKTWGFRTTPGIPQFESVNRSYIYGAMVGFFYVGAISFAVFAASTM